MSTTNDIRVVVREKYGLLAESGGGCGPGCGCGETDVLNEIGYTAEQKAAIPEGANLGLGCGNPLAWAELKLREGFDEEADPVIGNPPSLRVPRHVAQYRRSRRVDADGAATGLGWHLAVRS